MAKKGSNEAALARADEQARQQRIREGTTRINSIFDGGTFGSGLLDTSATFDPTATYYNADGSVWAPAGQITSGRRTTGKTAAQQFADAVKAGQLFSGTSSTPGFNDQFFTDRRDAYLGYATPQLEDQYTKAQKELTYALDRAGLLDSSARAQKASELQKLYDLNSQQIADQAQSYSDQTRNSVEDARANLIATLNATGDATGVANQALTRASILSQPAAYSPLSQLFSSFTAGLGTQAALERANYYSGGGTGARYSTGLFAPSSGSVVVTGG